MCICYVPIAGLSEYRKLLVANCASLLTYRRDGRIVLNAISAPDLRSWANVRSLLCMSSQSRRASNTTWALLGRVSEVEQFGAPALRRICCGPLLFWRGYPPLKSRLRSRFVKMYRLELVEMESHCSRTRHPTLVDTLHSQMP